MGTAVQRARETNETNKLEQIPVQGIDWARLSGSILPGGYELKELGQASAETAQFRVRVLGDRDLDAVAHFVAADRTVLEKQAEAWASLRALKGNHIAVPLAAGFWGETPEPAAAYVVLRRPDEALSGALRERALSPDEAKAVAENVGHALETLHVNGLVHGCLAPEQVLAYGDEIALSAECIRPTGDEQGALPFNARYVAPETHDSVNRTAEADVWCLGATLSEALTQSLWDDTATFSLLPEPFATVVRRTTEPDPSQRCTLAEAISLLRGEIPIEPAKTVQIEGVQPEPRISARDESVASAPDKSVAAPAEKTAPTVEAMIPDIPVQAGTVKPAQPELPKVSDTTHTALAPLDEATLSPAPQVPPSLDTQPARAHVSEPEARPRLGVLNSLWLWAAAALALVLILIWAFRPGPTAARVQPGPATTAPAPQQSATPAEAAKTKTLRPDGTVSPNPSAPTTVNTPSASAPTVVPARQDRAQKQVEPLTTRNVWRVILYTYSRREDAESKSAQINKAHPSLHTEVFAPTEGESPYLVSIVAGKARTDAEQARREARNNGMPVDSYVQNYAR